MPAISIVIPVYNSETYLRRFVASLQDQTFKDFEALFIDDASTDDSARLISALANADPRLKLHAQPENLGAGAARNLGIRTAAGETLCFADPDDVLPENSLEARYTAFKKHNAIVRACNDEIADTGALIHHGTRPANLPELCIPRDAAHDFGVNPFLSAHWTWLFPTRQLQRQGIFNEENTRTAEDIMFLARLFFNIERLVWIPDTVYYWVKREQSLSTARYALEHYADYLRCVDAFYQEAEKNRAAALGDRFCNDYLYAYLTHCVRQCLNKDSTEEDARRLVALAADICGRHRTFSRIPDDAGKAAAYAGLSMLRHALADTSPLMIQRLLNAHNAALEQQTAARYAAVRQKGWAPALRLDKYDPRQRLLRARYLFCGEHPEERFTHAGRPIAPAFAKSRLEYQGRDFTVFERILWLPIPSCNDGPLELHLQGRPTGLQLTPQDVRQAFVPAPVDERDLPAEARVLRKFIQSPAAGHLKGAWMFMDRDTQADDNAEHLYRWVMRNHPEINAWFVLREESPDWPRLQAEGFRLIPFGGMEHKTLFLLAKNLISSQMDRYVYSFLEDDHYKDVRRCNYISLQHGVICNDLSPWLNSVDMDIFVTSTTGEYHSIVDDGTGYALTAKEVARIGQARHDSLAVASPAERRIFIMPTWRDNLTGAWDGTGQRREYNPAFAASAFAQGWRHLLCSPALGALGRRYGYEIVFWPHPCLRDYLEEFNLPAYIRTPAGESIQSLLQSSGLLITDYSSIAFDMAALRRPVIYYHFESHAHFLESQGRRTGYFQHERDGFGPVCRSLEELLAALEKNLAAGCLPEARYLDRMERTMDLVDGRCCERTFAAIQALRKL